MWEQATSNNLQLEMLGGSSKKKRSSRERREPEKRRNNVLIFTQWIDDVFRCVDERNIKQVLFKKKERCSGSLLSALLPLLKVQTEKEILIIKFSYWSFFPPRWLSRALIDKSSIIDCSIRLTWDHSDHRNAVGVSLIERSSHHRARCNHATTTANSNNDEDEEVNRCCWNDHGQDSNTITMHQIASRKK